MIQSAYGVCLFNAIICFLLFILVNLLVGLPLLRNLPDSVLGDALYYYFQQSTHQQLDRLLFAGGCVSLLGAIGLGVSLLYEHTLPVLLAMLGLLIIGYW